jgi:hypothetical protein
MKLPAVAIAVAFAAGILLGVQGFGSRHAGSHCFLEVLLVGIGLGLAIGFFLAFLRYLWPAAPLSFTCWASLGFVGACLAQQPLPAKHILTRLKADQLDLRTPLRWHGRLRAEPTRVPSGYSLKGRSHWRRVGGELRSPGWRAAFGLHC